MDPQEREAVAARLAQDALGIEGLVVAGYLATPTEPDPGALLARAARVLLPVPLADGQLGWALDDGNAVPHGRLPVRIPGGPVIGHGAGALRTAGVSVLLIPGLAVGGDGWRLGQGGGYYDRLLAELPATGPSEVACRATPEFPLLACVVHVDEVLSAGDVPHGPHDQRVTMALTPEGVTELRWADTGRRR
jgi:5-formyltetrahydrofolate cyclo-ligase